MKRGGTLRSFYECSGNSFLAETNILSELMNRPDLLKMRKFSLCFQSLASSKAFVQFAVELCCPTTVMNVKLLNIFNQGVVAIL